MHFQSFQLDNLNFLCYRNYRMLQNITCYPMIAQEILNIGSKITLFMFKCVFDAKITVSDFHFLNRHIHHAHVNTFHSFYTCSHSSICNTHFSVLLYFILIHVDIRFMYYLVLSKAHRSVSTYPRIIIRSRDIMSNAYFMKKNYHCK